MATRRLSDRQRRILAVAILVLAALDLRIGYANRYRHPWLALMDVVVAIILIAGVIATW